MKQFSYLFPAGFILMILDNKPMKIIIKPCHFKCCIKCHPLYFRWTDKNPVIKYHSIQCFFDFLCCNSAIKIFYNYRIFHRRNNMSGQSPAHWIFSVHNHQLTIQLALHCNMCKTSLFYCLFHVTMTDFIQREVAEHSIYISQMLLILVVCM